MTEKKYKIINPGTGHSPHILENVDDSNDKVYLCSCGGTKNRNFRCDGTHAKKKERGCQCEYCKTLEQKVSG